MRALTLLDAAVRPAAGALLAPARDRFRTRVSGDPSGAPPWVREIATVGSGPGWFEPEGVVWRVHGDLATLVGGIAALRGQATHPLALAGVEQSSSYRENPWQRLAGTVRWLTLTTFGSAELAAREAARVRGLHRSVRGADERGRPYAAGDPELLRWVHLAFTDAFLAAFDAVGTDLSSRFGPRWRDAYVHDWARSAEALGAGDLPRTAAELVEAVAAEREHLAPVPEPLRAFLAAPPGLGPAEQAFYRGLVRAGGFVVHPVLAPLAGVPGREGGLPGQRRAALLAVRVQLKALRLAVGPASPSQEAARYRLGTGPAPGWLAA